MNLFRRLLNPKAAELTATITAEGMPIVTPRVELGDLDGDEQLDFVPHDQAFGLLDECLGEVGLTLWLALDRLDGAFAGRPEAEVPALRALLRTYLDIQPYTGVRLKLFVRKDLFRRVTTGGFVNLTHVNARKVEIFWDDESLAYLLHRRLTENSGLIEATGVDPGDRAAMLSTVFPAQVDPGDRKPTTYTWIMGRIRDGNDVRPPRNLIDLVQKSQEAAIRREERDRSEFTPGVPLIPSDALKAGLRILSKQRVEDTLLAEAGTDASLVERFRGGKAEHNLETLEELLAQTGEGLKDAIQFLRDIGFLEPVGVNFKVPILYRDGLAITQGKAFSGGGDTDED